MDNKKKELLRRHYQAVVKDLNVEYILDDLYSKEVISNEDYEEIRRKTTRTESVRYLLDSLLQKGANATFDAFIDCLAKDYSWLWQLLTENTGDSAMLNESFEDSLSRGSVPRLPDHYVKRNDLERDIAVRLGTLTRHKILVLHGMSGCGKTSVAISVLRDNSDLVTNNFNGSVFWLNLNNCKNEDDIMAHQNSLYSKASAVYTRSSYMNSTMSMSSISSNFDIQSLSSCEWTWQKLRDKLVGQFLEQTLKESLLVLDEVNDKLCVNAFDIGCKLLVTTRDSEVVSNLRAQIVRIDNSLSKDETLELLASYLGLEVQNLPKQAKKLHDACKGNPFNVSLIGAHLAEDKERLLHDYKRWEYYLKKLKKREFRIFSKPDDNPMTIEVCINSLQPDVLTLFKRLAILPHNVKVSAKVISKLWNKDVTEVEIIMKMLRKKSLIQETYDHGQRNYLYEVHDLIMDYLKKCFNEEETKRIHSELLKSYQYKPGHPPIEIVDDGYIAFYMGHHVYHTKNMNNSWKLFKLYLNLQFLGNKIRLTGHADVILDLEKYEAQIVEDEPERLLVNSVKQYLKTYGTDLYRYPSTDLVQSIIQHESEGVLYVRALEMARNNCLKNELYFEFVHERGVEEIKHSTIDVKETITSVCFLGDYVLAGTMSGLVKFFHIPTNKLRKELSGTGASIRWVGACPTKLSQVAALTNDGFVKLWHVDDIEQDEADDIIEEESDEVDVCNYASNCTISPKISPFLNCRWSNHQKTLVTHTINMVIVYNYDGKVSQVYDHFERDDEVTCCVPCNNDRYVIAGVANNGAYTVEVIDQKTKEKMMVVKENDRVLDICTIPGTNKIVTLKSREISVHEYIMHYLNGSGHTCRQPTLLAAREIKENLHFLAIAVSKTGTLLFVSTDDSRIICVDLENNSRAFDLENRRGNVISMAVSEVDMWDEFQPGSDVLLTGTGNVENCAKVWNLEASYVLQHIKRNNKVRLTKKFDVSFVNTLSPHTPTSSVNSFASATNSPRRHRSFVNHTEAPKRPIATSLSLDRHALKPLNLKGISNNNDCSFQPLLAVVDDKNNIQVMRGKQVLTEILTRTDAKITTVKITPCNHYVIYGLWSGSVKKYALRTKETRKIMDMNSPVQYLNFVTPRLLIAGGKNCCLMAYRLTPDGTWKTDMLQKGKTDLGSQEILNDLQGIKKEHEKKKKLSSSSNESLDSRNRVFPNGGSMDRLRSNSGLVDCFWVTDVGLITVENNAVVKLWDQDMMLASVLTAKQREVCEAVTCAAFQKNVLVVCDGYTPGFHTYELQFGEGNNVELRLIQDFALNNRIVSCDLTSDGHILAMGLETGEVVIWNVPLKRQIRLLKHHKNAVKSCTFSPMPDRLFRTTSANSPSPSPFSSPPPTDLTDAENTPLVLITMASEIVWWNVTYMLNTRSHKNFRRTGRNSMTPVANPVDNKNDSFNSENANSNSSCNNFFFGNGMSNSDCVWKSIWKGKRYKESAKKKEILSCIKLSGMNANKVCRDENFGCFVTVDNSGHIHIMNVMRSNKS